MFSEPVVEDVVADKSEPEAEQKVVEDEVKEEAVVETPKEPGTAAEPAAR